MLARTSLRFFSIDTIDLRLILKLVPQKNVPNKVVEALETTKLYGP